MNTAGIIAVVFAVTGTIFTIKWMGDTAPKGAPYFQAFSVGEAQAAIDAYNRKMGLDHPLRPHFDAEPQHEL